MKTTPALPKARLLAIEIRPETWRLVPFARFRFANAARIWLGPISIGWRMPWLPDVARRLHPECFGDEK